jgi:gamma-glutamylcyclotransferase (GGCT)/AIG2-like uncharacterized protein YtfP
MNNKQTIKLNNKECFILAEYVFNFYESDKSWKSLNTYDFIKYPKNINHIEYDVLCNLYTILEFILEDIDIISKISNSEINVKLYKLLETIIKQDDIISKPIYIQEFFI